MKKIPDDKKQKIIEDHATGEYSYGELAVKYLVSRSRVHVICNPEKKAIYAAKVPKKSSYANIIACKKYRDKKRAEK